jgi:hypothetical protein
LALVLIARVFEHLEQFYHRTGRAGLFRRLRPLVSADPDAASRASVAAELGMTEGNLRVAIHRMRARFAAGLRDEVAATLRDAGDDDVADELRALFAILEA